MGGGPHEGSPINVASHLYTTGEEFYNFYTSIKYIKIYKVLDNTLKY